MLSSIFWVYTVCQKSFVKRSNIIVISDLESADFVCSQTVKKVCISLQTREIISTQILPSDDQQINILYKICTLQLLQLEISLYI